MTIEATPSGWTGLQWLQAKALMLTGWELFNRRQDFSRLQPCDLRFSSDSKVLEVLIRYAKNDLRGKTRAPKLAALQGEELCCPVATMRRYMNEADISIHPECDKVWGEPFHCTRCEPLFPSILSRAKGGKRPRAMPDSRVTKIIKQVMVTLAKATDERLLTL